MLAFCLLKKFIISWSHFIHNLNIHAVFSSKTALWRWSVCEGQHHSVKWLQSGGWQCKWQHYQMKALHNKQTMAHTFHRSDSCPRQSAISYFPNNFDLLLFWWLQLNMHVTLTDAPLSGCTRSQSKRMRKILLYSYKLVASTGKRTLILQNKSYSRKTIPCQMVLIIKIPAIWLLLVIAILQWI